MPNSERGPKIQSLEGEIEIPHIARKVKANFKLTSPQISSALIQPQQAKMKLAKKSIRAMWGISISPSSDWILGPLSEFGTHMPIVNLGNQI